MSDQFGVNPDGLRRFRVAAERIQDRVADLRSAAEGVRLTPGTFTRTPGGQVADTAHTQLVDGIGSRIDAAVEQLQAVADATDATADAYESTDTRHASAMSDVRARLDGTRGYPG